MLWFQSTPHRWRFLALMLVLMASASVACARNRGGDGREGIRTDVIYRNEILRTTAQTAYDAVRLLRPAFLRSRGPTSINAVTAQTPVVYLDDTRFGDTGTLRNIAVQGIVEIRYINAAQAQMRWGRDHPFGAIQVVTGTGRPDASR